MARPPPAERRGCRDEGIGKGLIRPLLSQWLQLLQSCEQILLTGGLEPFGLNYIAGHKLAHDNTRHM